MKNLRKLNVMAVIAILGIVLSFTACDNGNDETDGNNNPNVNDNPNVNKPAEQPKNQSVIITGLLDNNSSATVQGYLTDTEWAGVPGKIKTTINDLYSRQILDAGRNFYIRTFAKDITIISDKEPREYTSPSGVENAWFNVDETTNTIFIDYNILNDETKLRNAISSGCIVLSSY